MSYRTPEDELLLRGIARLYGPNRRAVGAGVLVGPRHILTCAHVAAAAITGSKQTPETAPPGQLEVDFPAAAEPGQDPADPIKGHLLAPAWRPINRENRSGDIAVVELEEEPPRGAAPPPLLSPPDVRDREILAYGFLGAYESDPVISIGKVSGWAGPSLEWLQLDRVRGFRVGAKEGAIREGFSGTPVWDHTAGEALGIVVAIERDLKQGTAFMIPMSVLAKAWPALREEIGWRLRFDSQYALHWEPSARGTEHDEGGQFFTGRHRVLRDLVDWMENPDGLARVVTALPGSGKSAVLARLVTLADREQRDDLETEILPSGTVPPPGAVDLAIVAEGMSVGEVVATIARWMSMQAESPDALVGKLVERLKDSERMNEGGRAPLIVIDQLDGAEEPQALVRELLGQLIATGAARLIIGLRKAEDCPIARLLAAHTKRLDLDGEYREPADMVDYVERLLTERARADGYREGPNNAAQRVARAVADGAGESFLVAQLSTLWLCEQSEIVEDPPEGYPGDVTEAMDLYIDGLAKRHGGDSAHQEAAAAEIRDLMAALAYARGLGLPVNGPSWPAIAGAIRNRPPYAVDRPAQLMDTAARYLTRSAEVDGAENVRLFHRALAESLREGRHAAAVEARIVEALSDLCDRASHQPADPYIARDLAGHVAAAAAWEKLAKRPHVLDRLAPDAVRSEALPAELQHGSLPAPIVGLIRSAHLMARSGPHDRAGLRQLGMARACGHRSFGESDAAAPLAAWTIRSAVVRQHPARLTLDAGAAVLALASLPGPNGVVLLAAGCADGGVRLWSTATGAPFGELMPGGLDHDNRGVRALAAVNVGESVRVAIGSADGLVRIWDPLGIHLPEAFVTEHPRGGVLALAAFALGGDLCVASGGEDDDLRVRDGKTGALLWSLAGRGPVRALAASRSNGGVCLVGGSDDGSVRVWDLPAGPPPSTAADRELLCARTFNMLTDWVRAVCVFEGESGLQLVAAAGDDRRLALRRPAQKHGEPEIETGHHGAILALAPFTADGRSLLATAGDDASVRIWDTASGRQIGQPLTGHTDRIHAIAAYNIGASARIATGAGDRTIRIWDPSSATLGAGSAQGQEYPAPAVAMFDEIAVTGGEDGTIRTWDLMTGRAAGPPVEGGVGAVRVLLADPRWPETGIAVGGEEGVVRFLDALTGSELATPLRGHTGPVRTLALDIDVDENAAIATSGDDETVRLWSAADGKEIEEARSHYAGPVRGLAAFDLPPAGRCLAVVGADRTFVICSAADGRPIKRLQGHLDWPMAVCAYETGSGWRLLTAGDDRTVRLWNPLTGEQLALLGRHRGPVRAVAAFALGGQVRVASGGEDGVVRVWDPEGTGDAGGAGEPEWNEHPEGAGRLTHKLELGVRINALCAAKDTLLLGTDEGHLVVRLTA